jgi:hypothetical protein
MATPLNEVRGHPQSLNLDLTSVCEGTLASQTSMTVWNPSRTACHASLKVLHLLPGGISGEPTTEVAL